MHPLNLKPQAAMREGGTDALLPRWPFDLFVPGRKTRMTFTWLTCLFLFRSTAEPSTLILLSRWVPTETKVESGTSQSKRGTAVHLTVENTNQVATRNRRARCQGAGCRVQGSGFRVQGPGCRVQGSGFRVQERGTDALHPRGSFDIFLFHARPFVPSIKSHFWKISSTFDDKCPRNGSKNGLRAPRTGMGCPHIGSSVVTLLLYSRHRSHNVLEP